MADLSGKQRRKSEAKRPVSRMHPLAGPVSSRWRHICARCGLVQGICGNGDWSDQYQQPSHTHCTAASASPPSPSGVYALFSFGDSRQLMHLPHGSRRPRFWPGRDKSSTHPAPWHPGTREPHCERQALEEPARALIPPLRSTEGKWKAWAVKGKAHPSPSQEPCAVTGLSAGEGSRGKQMRLQSPQCDLLDRTAHIIQFHIWWS